MTLETADLSAGVGWTMHIFRQSPNVRNEACASVTTETSAGWEYPPELAVLDAVRPLDCLLTVKDYSLIEHHMLAQAERQGEFSLLVRLMRAKLTDAQIVMADDLPPDIATGNSRVEFAIDHDTDDQRVLCFWDHEALGHSGLPVTSILGTTLFGLRAGQKAPLIAPGGTIREIELKRVLFQPERARQSMRRQAGEGGDG